MVFALWTVSEAPCPASASGSPRVTGLGALSAPGALVRGSAEDQRALQERPNGGPRPPQNAPEAPPCSVPLLWLFPLPSPLPRSLRVSLSQMSPLQGGLGPPAPKCPAFQPLTFFIFPVPVLLSELSSLSSTSVNENVGSVTAVTSLCVYCSDQW